MLLLLVSLGWSHWIEGNYDDYSKSLAEERNKLLVELTKLKSQYEELTATISDVF